MSEWTDSGSDNENCRALSLFMIEARKSDSKLLQRKQSNVAIKVHCNICMIEMHTLLTSKNPGPIHSQQTHIILQTLKCVGIGAWVNTLLWSPWIKNMPRKPGVVGIGTPCALMRSAFYFNGRGVYVLTAKTQTMPVWNICQDIIGHEHFCEYFAEHW